MDTQGASWRRKYTSPQPASRKRLKIPIACAPCRRRKVKCDGARPVCCSCQGRASRAECVYSQGPSEAASLAEGGASSVRTAPRNEVIPNHQKTFSGYWPGLGGEGEAISASSASPVRDAVATSSVRLDSPPNETHGTDSMNGVTGDPTRTQEVFGNSSAGSFMRQIQAAINARLGAPPEGKKGAAKEQSQESQPPSTSREDLPLFLLPPRGLADSLMQAYWDNNWSLYPVIDRGKIETTYEMLWMSKTVHHYPLIPISVINLCFAIGCHYCKLIPPKERKSTGGGFFAHAESLYRKTGEAPSYERVQCLLLFGIYLQSTSSVFQCWMTVGQAIRMAQSLGIHLAHPTRSLETARHREYKRRTWHGCVWLDRVLSSTLGRPGMIPKWLFNSIPLPSMIDDEFFETQTKGSPLRPDGWPCRMAFPVKAMELYQILDEILVDLYLKSAKNEDIQSKLVHILEIDDKLQAWNKSLPEHLHTRHVAEDDEILKRQAIVLRVRFLHARILLFRPAVVSHCMRGAANSTTESPYDPDNSSLAEVMLGECSRICFRLAHELIETFELHFNPQTLLGPLPNWWYSVLYVYNATMMILVERFLESKDSSSPAPESKAYRTWHAALRVLKSYSVISDSATRCVAVLDIFSEKLFLNNNDSVNVAQNDIGYDWDSLWAMSNPLGQESSLSDPNLFPFTFDDFILTNAMSAPFAQAFLPSDQ